MINLLDTTFIINTKNITESNIKELRVTINFILKHYTTNILIVESSNYPKLKYLYDNLGYLHIAQKEGMVGSLNTAIKSATSKYVIVLDQGLLAKPSIVNIALTELRKGKLTYILPYGKEIRHLKYNDALVKDNTLTKSALTDKYSYGIVNFACINKQLLRNVGYLNESIEHEYIRELSNRCKLLGAHAAQSQSELFSLSDMIFDHLPDYEEMSKLAKFDLNELNAYISNWDWTDSTNRVINPVDADVVLFSALDVLSECKAVAFITQGTLLGAVRDNNYIGHDLDIDLGVNYKPGIDKKIEEEMKNAGFNIELSFFIGDQICEHSYRKNGIKIDIFFFNRDGDSTYCYFFHRKGSETYYANKVSWNKFTTRDKSFRGTMVPTPYPPKDFVIEHYGDTWNQVIKNWVYYRDPKNMKLVEETGRVVIH